MREPAPDKALLQGKRVAFTGRLASMTRADAADLIRAHGGRFTATLNRFTSLLVVGQDGWPFEKDGRLSGKLRKARSLQRNGIGTHGVDRGGIVRPTGPRLAGGRGQPTIQHGSARPSPEDPRRPHPPLGRGRRDSPRGDNARRRLLRLRPGR